METHIQDSIQPIDLVIIGCGTVGSALLSQLQSQGRALKEHGIVIRVVAIANSRRMIVDPDGLSLATWKESLGSFAVGDDCKGDDCKGDDCKSEETNLGTLRSLGSILANPVLVDCTASDVIPAAYTGFLSAGFNVVSPNKRGNTSGMDDYLAIRRIARAQKRQYLYEATVGAGLPVLDNLKKLLLAGDQLIRFQGILSGSLSFMLGEIEVGRAFSSVVREAMDRGFTEPDPRNDLSGTDVARKVLILAREAGLALELPDIELAGLVPAEYMALTVDEFMYSLPELDGHFKTMMVEASKQAAVPRFVGSIDSGRCRAGLQFIRPDHPLYSIRGGENALAFSTRYYDPIPLVIRGYGAGAQVSAAGVFSDILRTVNYNRIP